MTFWMLSREWNRPLPCRSNLKPSGSGSARKMHDNIDRALQAMRSSIYWGIGRLITVVLSCVTIL